MLPELQYIAGEGLEVTSGYVGKSQWEQAVIVHYLEDSSRLEEQVMARRNVNEGLRIKRLFDHLKTPLLFKADEVSAVAVHNGQKWVTFATPSQSRLVIQPPTDEAMPDVYCSYDKSSDIVSLTSLDSVRVRVKLQCGQIIEATL